MIERPIEWWAKRVDGADEGCVTAGAPSPLEDLKHLLSEVADVEGAVITHVYMDPDLLAGIRLFRPAIGKRMSIRAYRRNQGRMKRGWRLAKAAARNQA